MSSRPRADAGSCATSTISSRSQTTRRQARRKGRAAPRAHRGHRARAPARLLRAGERGLALGLIPSAARRHLKSFSAASSLGTDRLQRPSPRACYRVNPSARTDPRIPILASASSPAENSAADCRSGWSPAGRSQGRPQPSRSDASAFVNGEVSGGAGRGFSWRSPLGEPDSEASRTLCGIRTILCVSTLAGWPDCGRAGQCRRGHCISSSEALARSEPCVGKTPAPIAWGPCWRTW